MNFSDLNILPWLIPIPPLVAFFVIILFAGRSKLLTHIIAIGAIFLSWLMSFYAVYTIVTQHKDLGTAAALGGKGVFASSVTWLVNGATGPGTATGALGMGVMLDPLNTIMLFMVPLACLLIFIYTLGYMAHDPRNTRFFAFLSLFAGAMLTLVVADNLLLLFIGWEVMGLCSYLLIGFWYEKPSAYQAAIKAFMTTRVGDVIMMIGIAYLWASTGTLSFRAILHNEDVLHKLATTPALGGFLGLTAAGLIGLCIVAGTIGKSAQFPLHVWLPDAMEGPTPVSAMIHAAAMVSAGVYLVIRMYPLLSAGGNPEAGVLTPPMILMSIVGSFTALFAATIAVSQNDIKKVLAYSTISQLGFMIAALGIGAYVAAAFHLITHAFFKALLFLGSGSVIHAMEHGEHAAHAAHEGHTAHDQGHVPDASPAHGGHEAPHAATEPIEHHEHPLHDPEPAFDPQDMRNMGGLGRNMPVTMWTFIIGGASLAGFPLITAGFWSKDEILADAWHLSAQSPLAVLVLVSLAVAAILTAFYTFRQIALTFWGEPRTEAAKFAQHNDGTAEARNISAQMTAPLIVLAFMAIVAGFAGVNPGFPIIGAITSRFFPQGAPFANFVGRTLLEAPEHLDFSWWPVLVSFSVFLIGVGMGYALYVRRQYALGQKDPMEDIVGADIYRILQKKYYVDEFYGWAFINPLRWIATTLVSQIVDKGIIDGTLNIIATSATWIGNLFREFNRVVIDGVSDGIPDAIADAGRSLRSVQSGHIQQYLLYALVAALWVGLNLILLAVFPLAVPWAALAQVVIAVLLILFFNVSGSRASN
ncbi:MAG: NADH-quinone oxidoreductase subunit L [Chloroflexota bacterium]